MTYPWHDEPTIDEKTLVDLRIVYAENIVFTLDEYTAARTLSLNNYLVLVNAPGNTKITLPAATYNTSRIYTIKNIHSTGTVTIDANSTEEIDGELTVVLNLQYAYLTIVCDGSEWFIIGGEYVKMEDILRQILSEVQKLNKIAEDTLEEVEKVND